MGTSYYKLDIENRDSVGKKATKEMRRAGMVPSTLYFKGEEPESIAVEKLKLYQALKSDQRIYEIELEGESQYVMVKAVQYHPVTDEILHLDFMRVRRSEKMTISVPLVLVGKPIGITEGGILSQALNQIDDMELNSSISIADVSYDDDEVDIISAEDINVASITAPAAEEEITEADADDSADDSEDGGEKDEKSEDSSDQKESSE